MTRESRIRHLLMVKHSRCSKETFKSMSIMLSHYWVYLFVVFLALLRNDLKPF